jgi:hypothetical protein
MIGPSQLNKLTYLGDQHVQTKFVGQVLPFFVPAATDAIGLEPNSECSPNISPSTPAKYRVSNDNKMTGSHSKQATYKQQVKQSKLKAKRYPPQDINNPYIRI